MPVFFGTLSQPMLYFSKRQRNVIIRCGLSALDSYADRVPGWIPAYIVASALGFDAKGVEIGENSYVQVWKLVKIAP